MALPSTKPFRSRSAKSCKRSTAAPSAWAPKPSFVRNCRDSKAIIRIGWSPFFISGPKVLPRQNLLRSRRNIFAYPESPRLIRMLLRMKKLLTLASTLAALSSAQDTTSTPNQPVATPPPSTAITSPVEIAQDSVKPSVSPWKQEVVGNFNLASSYFHG